MKTHYCPYCMSPVAEGESCSACGLTAGAYTPAPHHLPPGTVLLDRYMVGRVLGEGGFGITYIGCDLRLEMKVAIKEYFPTDKATRHASSSLEVESYTGTAVAGYDAGKAKFLREARTMARMDKQRLIVGVRDFFEENNSAYIVMEYVEGTTFKELVRQKGGRIPAGELLHLIEPLFPALGAMHEKGLIHRDISPDNLMLENGEVRLLDFGCARESSHGTQTMTIALKHGYAPIEQYQRKGQGPWTDVYALCGTIYYCLTGRVPPQALDRLCGDELILPRKLGVDLTENQERALLYGMGIRPAHRYQSVQELYAALYTGVPAPKPREERVDFSRLPRESKQEPNPERDAKNEYTGRSKPEAESPAVKEEEASSETKQPKKKSIGKRIWIPAVCAVVLFAVGVIALISKGTVSAPTEAGETLQASDDSKEASFVPDALFDGAVTMTADENGVISEEAFRTLLSDDSVMAVILPEGSSTCIVSMEFLEIGKPVLLEKGAYLTVTGETCVAGEGVLYVKGDFSPAGITRTEFGGKIYLADDVESDISTRSLILLENEEDLIRMGSGVLDVFEDHIVTFNERAVFEKAVTVSDESSLINALRYDTVPAVEITGDISINVADYVSPLENQLLYCNKPMRINSGATLTVTGGELYLDHEGNGHTDLVIRGTFHGSVNTDGALIFVGQGVWEGGAFIGDNTTLLNMGDSEILISNGFRPANDTYNSFGCASQIYNLGKFTIANGAQETMTCDFESWLYNYGDFHVYGNVLVNFSAGNNSLGNQVWNYGDMNLAADHEVVNRGYFFNCGNLQIRNGGLLNAGMIRTYNDIGVVSQSGSACFRNTETGVVLANQMGAWMPDGFVLSQSDWDDSAAVYSEQQLLLAVKSPSVSAIRLNAPITVHEDLTITKPFWLGINGALEVEGTITVSGAPLVLESYRGDCITAHELILEQGGMLIQEPSHPVTDGAVSVSAGSIRVETDAIYVHGRSGFIRTESIELESGGCFLALEPLVLEDTAITIGESCAFWIQGTLSMDRWDVLVQGQLICNSYIDFGPQVRLVNYGLIQLQGSRTYSEEYWVTQVCQAEIVNYGKIYHGGQILTLTGTVDNQGVIYAGEDENNNGKASILIGPGGKFTGNEIVRHYGDFDWTQ